VSVAGGWTPAAAVVTKAAAASVTQLGVFLVVITVICCVWAKDD
jgi:hypothetical protein